MIIDEPYNIFFSPQSINKIISKCANLPLN